MVKSLERAIAKVKDLPSDVQDDLARLMMLYLGEDEQPLVDLTSEQESAVRRSRDAARRGEVASDEEMQAIWSKYGS